MPSTSTRRADVWLAPEQAPLVREIAAAAGLSIGRAGSPLRGQSGGVAADLGAVVADDLRAALAAADGELFLITDPGDFGTGQEDGEAEAIAAARARGVRIVTLEPVPATPLELAHAWTVPVDGVRPAESVVMCGTLAACPALRDGEFASSFGAARTLNVCAWSRPEEGTLGARLWSAMDLVRRLMGEPETVDAAYVAPGRARGLHALPAESLRGLSGDMACNCRFGDGRAASITVSNHAAAWGRSVTMLGEGGRATIGAGTEWIGADGKSHEPGRRSRAASAGEELGAEIRRVLDGETPEPPVDHAAVLAMCHAALLSCRTGQAEYPATIRRMAGT
ncbi:MAG: hypothetical protein IT437_02735 [Phycisphaerales bacterium]|nr:hypothetical protein [Phycisphaerales bacterium]